MGLRRLAILAGLLSAWLPGCAAQQFASPAAPVAGCCGDANCRCMKGTCGPACSTGCSLWEKLCSKRTRPKACCGDPRCRCMMGQVCVSGPHSPVGEQALPPVSTSAKPNSQSQARPERIGHLPRAKPQEIKLESPPAPAGEAARKPVLALVKSGPARRFVGKTIEHTIEVRNQGNAAATGVVVIDHLPAELKLTDKPTDAESAGNEVRWHIDTLDPGDSRGFTIKTQATQVAAKVVNRVTVTCKEGSQSEAVAEMEITGQAALRLEVFDLSGSVPVDQEAEYVVRVTNQGVTAARELRVRADVPNELKPLAVAGLLQEVIQGQIVQMPAFELTPGMSRTFRLKLAGVQTGDARMKVTLTGRDLETPVVEEESTTVLPPAKVAQRPSSE